VKQNGNSDIFLHTIQSNIYFFLILFAHFTRSNDLYCIVIPTLGLHIHLKCLCVSVSFRSSFLMSRCCLLSKGNVAQNYVSNMVDVIQVLKASNNWHKDSDSRMLSDIFYRNSIFEIPIAIVIWDNSQTLHMLVTECFYFLSWWKMWILSRYGLWLLLDH